MSPVHNGGHPSRNGWPLSIFVNWKRHISSPNPSAVGRSARTRYFGFPSSSSSRSSMGQKSGINSGAPFAWKKSLKKHWRMLTKFRWSSRVSCS